MKQPTATARPFTILDFRMLFDAAREAGRGSFDDWLQTEFLVVRSDPKHGIWMDMKLDGMDQEEGALDALPQLERDVYQQQHPRNDVSLPVLPLPFTLDDFMLLAHSACFSHSAARWPDDADIQRMDGINPGTATLMRALLEQTKPRNLRPRGLQAQQEALILDTIRRLGFDPLNLPPRPNGKAGIKAVVRKSVSSETLFTGNETFRLAWERLSAQTEIRYGQPAANQPDMVSGVGAAELRPEPAVSDRQGEHGARRPRGVIR